MEQWNEELTMLVTNVRAALHQEPEAAMNKYRHIHGQHYISGTQVVEFMNVQNARKLRPRRN